MSAVMDACPLTPLIILGETYYVTKIDIDARGWADLRVEKYEALSYKEQEEIQRRDGRRRTNDDTGQGEDD